MELENKERLVTINH